MDIPDTESESKLRTLASSTRVIEEQPGTDHRARFDQAEAYRVDIRPPNHNHMLVNLHLINPNHVKSHARRTRIEDEIRKAAIEALRKQENPELKSGSAR